MNSPNGATNLSPGEAEKQRLVALLEQSRRATLAALQGINDWAVVDPASGWCVKDVLGHIATWEREALACLQTLHEGDAYTPPADGSVEAYNQRRWAERGGLDAAQLRMDWAMVRRDLQFAVLELAPECMAESILFPWREQGTVAQMVEELVGHEQEHLAELLPLLTADAPRSQAKHGDGGEGKDE